MPIYIASYRYKFVQTRVIYENYYVNFLFFLFFSNSIPCPNTFSEPFFATADSTWWKFLDVA
jgi:hypothetical protein